MQDFGISPGFIDGVAQDQQNLTVGNLEIVVQAAQLSRVTAALHSNKFTDEE